MEFEELMKLLENIHFEYTYEPVNYDPIKPINYPSEERTFVKHDSYSSNTIGQDCDEILALFCYDAK